MATIKCPECGAVFEDQLGFGMVECPHCHHMSMSGASPEAMTTLHQRPTTATMITPEVQSAPQPIAEPTPDPSEEPEISQASFTMTTPNREASFEDVIDFANSEIPSTGSNALFYNVIVSGIDTPELRDELEDILNDRKLNLPPSVIMPKIKQGTLKLEQLHPVRAAVLVSKLRNTHLRVKWNTDQMIKVLKSFLFIVFALGSFKALASSWEYHDQSLKSYAIRINNLQDEIHDTIVKKNNETNLKKKEEYLEEIKRKYADLRGMHKDFLKEMEHVRYEHPERGDKVERKYVHLKVKTLEELENDNTLDGQLSRIKRKAEMKYKPEEAPKH